MSAERPEREEPTDARAELARVESILERLADTRTEPSGEADRFGANRRLIVYGSLVPGGSNHHEVEHLGGTWTRGWITGSLAWTGWGADLGYPALSWAPKGERIPAQILESDDLPDDWARLDEFEGSEYRRILVPFFRDDGGGASWVVGQVYADAK